MKLIVGCFSAIIQKQSAWTVDNILVSRDKIPHFLGILGQRLLLILLSHQWLVDFRHLKFRTSLYMIDKEVVSF